jgi:hypothetical protein
MVSCKELMLLDLVILMDVSFWHKPQTALVRIGIRRIVILQDVRFEHGIYSHQIIIFNSTGDEIQI